MASPDKKIAIVGNGGAAAECLKALRENGYHGEIHLFANNNRPVSNPMLTTYYVAGKIGFAELFPYGNDDSLFRRYDVTFHPGSAVAVLDVEHRLISTASGFEFRYDSCLVASGASPVRPPIEGMESSRVFTMRSVEDAVRLKAAMLARPEKALVIGASMVGIKLVELFHEAGMQVCLADMASHLFPLAAHPECAEVMESRLEGSGVRLRLGARLQRIEETPRGVMAYFEGSDKGEEADLLAVCVGVRPNIGFLDRKQVEVRQGIVVDERMRSSVPGLYAAGDVAQGKDLLSGAYQIFGLWATARYQGRAAGRNLAGASDFLPGVIAHNITHFMGMDFVGIGDVREYDRMEKQRDGKSFRQMFWRDGRLVGANLLDAIEEAGIIKNVILKGLFSDGFRPDTGHLGRADLHLPGGRGFSRLGSVLPT